MLDSWALFISLIYIYIYIYFFFFFFFFFFLQICTFAGVVFAQMWLFAHLSTNGSTNRHWQQRKHGSMGFHKTPLWQAYPYSILRSLVIKFKRNLKMTTISRNWHGFKFTQIERSLYHSLLRKMLYLMMSKITLLVRKLLKIRRSAFWDTRYRMIRIFMRPCHNGKGEI